jgi:MraZ protein
LALVESLKGRDERSLDPKARVIVPQRFRSLFAPEGVLAPHADGCIALWTTAEYGEEIRRQNLRGTESAARGHEFRRWCSMCSDFSLDQQGRMIVPSALREYAKLTTEVLFFGVFDRVELWSKQMWEAREAAFGSTGS